MAKHVIEFDPERPLDYEAVRKAFFDKGAADNEGQGRFESAFFHVIQAVHGHGIAGNELLLQQVRDLQQRLKQANEAAAACVAIFHELDEAEIEAYPPSVQRTWQAGYTITHEGS